ncbi:unnamed protein product [Closterium sp. Naga37s-1]|nr:unnamed protein product [Closterium sp. Naga37s-1]
MLGVTSLLNETSSYSVAPCVQKLVADGAMKVFNESDGLFPGAVFTGMNTLKPFPKNYVSLDTSTDPGPLKTLDIVIDETYLMTGPSGYSIDAFALNAGISVTDTATYKFLATPNVWSMYGRATGAPNYATGAHLPQVVLAELISIMHPGDVAVPEKYYFYNVAQLETGAVVSAADCTTLDPTEVVNPIIPACSATITPEVPGTANAPATPPSSSPPSSPPPSSPPPSSPPPAPKAAASSGSLLGAGLAALLAATIAALV